MKERSIGEKFKLGDKLFECVEAHGKNCCHFCAFSKPESDDQALDCVYARCESGKREDGNEVRFKEVK